MKLLLAAAAAVLLTTPAQVKSNTPEEIHQVCSALSKYARTVMTGRQLGAKISDMLDVLAKHEPSIIIDMSTEIVFRAFDVPRYQTEEMIDMEIVDFGNREYLNCKETLSG